MCVNSRETLEGPMEKARITYRCPRTNTAHTVGPANYHPYAERRRPPSEDADFFVKVDCLCGQSHTLTLENE